MNLTIDIGNTRAKLTVFKNNKILKNVICPKEELISAQKHLLNEFPQIQNGILANVAEPKNSFVGSLQGFEGTTIELSEKTPVPFINHYETTETLGLDRIALAVAAVTLYPNKNILVIDAGTCVTYDIITSDKIYLGGAISPGLNMRFRAINNFTANLPLLKASSKQIPMIGQNTIQSLHLGTTQGLIFELEGFITRYKQSFSDLTVILTGGDAEILSKSLKNSIFVAKNFLSSGLNCILEYNKH